MECIRVEPNRQYYAGIERMVKKLAGQHGNIHIIEEVFGDCLKLEDEPLVVVDWILDHFKDTVELMN